MPAAHRGSPIIIGVVVVIAIGAERDDDPLRKHGLEQDISQPEAERVEAVMQRRASQHVATTNVASGPAKDLA